MSRIYKISTFLITMSVVILYGCDKKKSDVSPNEDQMESMVIATLNNKTLSLDGRTGTIKWEINKVGKFGVGNRKLYMEAGDRYRLNNPNDTTALYAMPDTMKNLFILDGFNGKAIWAKNTLLRPNFVHVCCTPSEQSELIGIAGDIALFHSKRTDAVEYNHSKAIYAYDLTAEKIKWVVLIEDMVYPSLINGKIQVDAPFSHECYFLDIQTGKEIQKYSSDSPHMISGGYFFSIKNAETLIAIDEISKEVKWEFRGENGGPASYGSFVAGDNGVYYGTDWGMIYGVDKKTGAQKWEFRTDRQDFIGEGRFWEGMVIFPAREGRIYALDAETGQLKWRAWVGDGIWEYPSRLTIKNGRIFTSISGKRLFCLDAKTGKKKWDFNFTTPQYYGVVNFWIFDKSELDF